MVPIESRVRVYIDGFNLYFSMKENNWRKYYWLDLWNLSIKILQKGKSQGYIPHGSEIDSVRYFTSRIGETGRQRAKATRQTSYLEAIEAYCRQIKANLTISYGKYQIKPHICEHCNRASRQPIEKMTDVNISTDLLVDAFYDKYDIGVLISGDSDLTSPIKSITGLLDNKSIIVALPPGRWSQELTSAADRFLKLEERHLRQCQLPREIIRHDGYKITRPDLWI